MSKFKKIYAKAQQHAKEVLQASPDLCQSKTVCSNTLEQNIIASFMEGYLAAYKKGYKNGFSSALKKVSPEGMTSTNSKQSSFNINVAFHSQSTH